MKLSSIVSFLSSLAILTLIMGVVYASVQQVYRMGANDPQIQIAQDIAFSLERGRSPDYFFNRDMMDISKSLAVFAVLYNAAGEPVKADGLLDGKMPQPPSGVFEFANRNQENRISWQPQRDVRIAMVIVKEKLPAVGFVGVGRSLKEVELREKNLSLMVLIGWSMGVVILLVQAPFKNRGDK